MSEVSDRYRVVADGFTERLQGVSGDAWSAQSPCTEWTARDVAVHVVNTQRSVRAALDGGEAAKVDADADLMAQWLEARSAITEAVEDDQLASTTVSGMFGEQPFESLVGRLLCTDTLVHTWDLARATGQDDRLDPGAVAAAQSFLEPIDDAIRRPGGFSPKITPAPGADAQTAFLNFCGRAV